MVLSARKQFLVIGIVFCSLLIVSGVIAGFAIAQAYDLDRLAEKANTAAKNITDLSNLSDDYILNINLQVASRWNLVYSAAKGNITLLYVSSGTEQLLIRELLLSLNELQQNISEMNLSLSQPTDQATAINLWNQIKPEIKNLTTNALTLSSLINDDANRAEQTCFVDLLIFAVFLGSFVVIVYSQIYGSTIKSFEKTKRKEDYLARYSQELEKAVEERTRALKDTERLAAIGQTAGMVGHDIRNPLQAIMSDVYLLETNLESMPDGAMKLEVAESLDSIEQNIGYINKIVADLQDYARTLAPEYSEVNLAEVIGSLFKAIIIPDNIKLTIDVQGFPKIRSDPQFIRRALTNLVNNAIQAMPDGGQLKIEAFEKAGKACIIVSDTGVGVPEEVKPKLFTPMMTTKSKGQGLGLAVVKRLIEALNGTINFESQEGKGTKFTIELPTGH